MASCLGSIFATAFLVCLATTASGFCYQLIPSTFVSTNTAGNESFQIIHATHKRRLVARQAADESAEIDNTILLALTQDVGSLATFAEAVSGHEMLRILDVKLKVREHTQDESTINKLEEVDVVCFECNDSVDEWLRRVDKTLGIDPEEENKDFCQAVD